MSAIKKETLIDLTSKGIPETLMRFKNVSLQSDKFVYIRADDHVSIVGLQTGKTFKLNSTVDSAIINPSKNIIGLRAKQNLQIFDLSAKKKINSTVMDPGEPISYWAWIDDNTIVIVTAEKVYHWEIMGQKDPTLEFEREPYEGNIQIINYRASKDGNWLLINGIAVAQNGGIEGILQLYSKIKNRSQLFKGCHAGCFATFNGLETNNGNNKSVELFCFTQRTSGVTKVNAVEMASDKEDSFHSVALLDKISENDFIVSINGDEKHGFLFLVSKVGFLYVTDVQSGEIIHCEKVSADSTVFHTVRHLESGGIVTLCQKGLVAKYSVDEENFAAGVSGTNPSLAIRLATRLNLPIEKEFVQNQFEKLFSERKFDLAAEIADCAPGGMLRTEETVKKFSEAKTEPGKIAPLLQYFSLLLRRGRLSEFESAALLTPIIMSNSRSGEKKIEEWIRNDKITPSENVGDILARKFTKLACSVYLRSECHMKAIECFVLLGHFDKIPTYASKKGVEINFKKLLKKVCQSKKDKGKEFATKLVKEKHLKPEMAAEILYEYCGAKEMTAMLLEILSERGDLSEDAELQTRLLEVNIKENPEVAEAVLDSDEYRLSHYDRHRIADLCESAGMYSKALENYEDIGDIQRCLKAGLAEEKLNKNFVINYFGELSNEEALACLGDILSFDAEGNSAIAEEIAKKYSEQMTPKALVNLFESLNMKRLLFNYLSSVVNGTKDADIVTKYIETAVECKEINELRRVLKKNEVFDPQKTKEYIFAVDLEDPRPLIEICGRFGFIAEMTRYLYKKPRMFPFLQAYLEKVNPKAVPEAVDVLIDLGASDEEIKMVLHKIKHEALGEKLTNLIESASRKGKNFALLPWLEKGLEEGVTLPDLHNGLAKIYVEQNLSPERFLETNKYYEPLSVCDFLEARNPRFAFIALKRVPGKGDKALLKAAKLGGMYSELAEVLIERQDESFWAKALSENDEHRGPLIEQVVSVLENSRSQEEISVVVKAFISAELPKELIELLERLVLGENGSLQQNQSRNMQNLLILTAIKADPSRVGSYLEKLTDYDGPKIAAIASSEKYELFEESFEIYVRFGKNVDAVRVLIEKLKDLDRAKEFCEKVNDRELWRLLGESQLKAGRIADSIASFIKAKSFENFKEVYSSAAELGEWEKLVEYLEMASKEIKDPEINAELLFAYAKTKKLEEISSFMQQRKTTQTKTESVGDKCMKENLNEAAKIIFEKSNNFSRLAACLVSLGRFEEAVAAAERANSVAVWKQICQACVEAENYDLAKLCAVRIAAHADQLPALVKMYEAKGLFEEVISVLEKAVTVDRAHPGLFTALAVSYCKHKPEKLRTHLKIFGDKLNVQEVSKTALKFALWKDAVFLLKQNGQYDRAAQIAMQHSPSCFDHSEFKSMGAKISSSELLMKEVKFYIEEHPEYLDDFLLSLSKRLDSLRVIALLKSRELLPLATEYLFSAQKSNLKPVNEAINSLLIEEENLEGLKKSIETYTNFDCLSLASQLRKHKLKGFRALSARLFNKSGNFERGIEILKEEELYSEMVSAARDSKNRVLMEKTVRFFAAANRADLVAEALLEGGSMVRPHLALEIGWRHRMQDVVMPFVIQAVSDFESRVEALEEKEAKREKEEKESKASVKEEKILRITAHRGEQSINGSGSLF